MLKVNVGGKIFVTTKETLCHFQNCYFDALFKYNNAITDETTNEIFVDRNPKYFDLILDYMRGYNIDSQIDKIDYNDICYFMNDIEYYNMPDELINKSTRKQDSLTRKWSFETFQKNYV